MSKLEFDILYAIQGIRSKPPDDIMLAITTVVGDYGYLWLAVGVLLLLFRKTRRCGAAVLLAYGITFVIGQYVLKDLIARARPCHIDETVELLVKRPSSYSCPSTHTAWSFAAATAICCYFRKWGIVTFVVAAIIGFSRMYLFVHFPTDVLLGAVLGTLSALAAVKIVNVVSDKLAARKAQAKKA